MITDTSTLISKVKELGPWFHQIEVAEGVRTRDIAPSPGPQPRDHPLDRWIILEKVIPRDLSGLRILDIGALKAFLPLRWPDAAHKLWRSMPRPNTSPG